MQHGLAFVVGEGNVVENHFARDAPHSHLPSRILIFGALAQLPHLARLRSRPGQRFADLRSDPPNLKDRAYQKRQEHGEHEELP